MSNTSSLSPVGKVGNLSCWSSGNGGGSLIATPK